MVYEPKVEEVKTENPVVTTPVTESNVNENQQFIDAMTRRIAELEQAIQNGVATIDTDNVDDDNDGKLSTIEIIRHSMRPFMTVWFSISYVALVFYGLHADKINLTEALLTLGTILTTILGYCFGKSSAIDQKIKTGTK